MVAMINTALLRAMGAVAGLKARLSEERGQDLLEYVMLGGLIALVVAAALALALTTDVLDGFTGTIADCIQFDSPCGN